MDEILDLIQAEPNATREAARRPNLRTKLLSLVLVAVVLFALAFYFWHQISKLNARIAELNKETARLAKEMAALQYDQILNETLSKKYISLTSVSIQHTDNGFLVGKISLEPYLTGYKINGVMINNQSVYYRDAKFDLTVGDSKQDFTVDQLAPGSSGPFSVYIPNLKAKDATVGEISYRGAMIHFRE